MKAIRDLTVGQRWRLRRNLVIYCAFTQSGFSQRLLADVFDLPRSRIAAIIAEVELLSDKLPSPAVRHTVASFARVAKRAPGTRNPGLAGSIVRWKRRPSLRF